MRSGNTGRYTASLQASGIGVTRGGRQILRGVSLEVEPGELVGLIGPNGAGKSTLLAVMAGLSKADHGQVMLSGKPLHTLSDTTRAQLLGWLEQTSTVHWPVSVEYLVTLGRIPYLSSWQSPSAEDREAVNRALTATDCDRFRDQSVMTLSGGELTRVMLARALAVEPMLLLADEPTAALDIGHQLQTMDYLRAFASGQRACVVVLHDLSLAARYCDRVYLLDDGKLLADGKPAAVLTKENIRHVYEVDTIVGGTDVPWIVPVKRVPSS